MLPSFIFGPHYSDNMILCLETSGKACSIALSHHGQVVASKEAEGEWSHSRAITILIQQVLDQIGIQMKELEAVAISQGPGSYTGLRVGASCGKGICYAQEIPLISIPTLEIIAVETISDHLLEDEMVVPMIDARRMEVYYNIYTSDLIQTRETTNLVIEESSFESFASEKLVFCGDGAHKMAEIAAENDLWRVLPSYAKASAMAGSAYDKLMLKEFEDVAYYVPFYLKPPNITKSTKALF